MSHDAKVGSRPRYDRALRALAAAQRREAAACDRFADLIDAASLAACERSRALSDGAKASARLAGAFEDREEANRTHRQAELMLQQSGQAKAESAATQTRAK